MKEMTFSIKELRARKGWTQKEVAERVGVSPQTYNAWEKDISNVGVRKVMALADLFEVPLSQIKI